MAFPEIPHGEMELFEQQQLNLGDGSRSACRTPFITLTLCKMCEDWREFFACLLLPFSLHLSHNSLNIHTSSCLFLFLSCPPYAHLTGQVKRGEEQQEATASLRAEAPLLWSSTADMIIDGIPPPPQKRPSESSLWIQAVLISVIFISTLQKQKRTKGPKKLFVSQSSPKS